jgi:hypothetical protein
MLSVLRATFTLAGLLSSFGSPVFFCPMRIGYRMGQDAGE